MKHIIRHLILLVASVVLTVDASARQAYASAVDSLLLTGSYEDARASYDRIKGLPKGDDGASRIARLNAMGRLALRLGLLKDAQRHFSDAYNRISKEGWQPYDESWETIFGLQCIKLLQEPVLSKKTTYVMPERQMIEYATDNPLYAGIWSQFLARLSTQGYNFEDADKEYREAIDHYRRHPHLSAHYPQCVMEYARQLSSSGKYESAISLIEGMIAELQQQLAPSSIQISTAHLLSGEIALSLGTLHSASSHLDTARRLMEENGDTCTPEYADMLCLSGRLAMMRQEYDRAIPYFDKAAQLRGKLFGTDSPSCISASLDIVDIYLATGRVAEAEKLNDSLNKRLHDLPAGADAFSGFIRTMGAAAEIMNMQGFYRMGAEMALLGTQLQNDITSERPESLKRLYNIAGYAYSMDQQPERAIEQLSRYLDIERRQARETFLFLTESRRAEYWGSVTPMMERLFAANREGSITMTGGGVIDAPAQNLNRSATLLYDAALLNKGLMLEASVNLSRLINDSGDSVLIGNYNRLLRLKQRINAGETQLRQEADRTEQSLIKRSRKLGDYMNFASLTWRDIRDRLRHDEMAVEFICSRDSLNEYYSAEIVTPGCESPRHLFLFAARPDDSRMSGVGIYGSRFLSRKIWGRVLADVKPGTTVYFSPAGQLYNIAIEYLPLDDSTRVNDRHGMVRLSSTRELARRQQPVNTPSAVLYGGLNYNTSIDDMMLYAADMEPTRGVKREFSSDGTVTRTPWGYLRATRAEVDNIADDLSSVGYEVAKFTGDYGIEETFKALSGSRNSIIHVATHGFYLPSDLPTSHVSPMVAGDMSLQRSGLVLSGANNAWLGDGDSDSGMEDGILTAKEISLLDLSGTGLVVMSACQTGLGEVTGEGVFGLQRAFKLAGAQTLVMSLWPVHDDATRVMMSEFYRHLATGTPKAKAFALAREQVMHSTFTVDGRQVSGSEPQFWAAFIMMD